MLTICRGSYGGCCVIQLETSCIRVQMVISKSVALNKPVDSLRFVELVGTAGPELAAHTLTWELWE